MQKAYNQINWQNYPSEETPVNETNLNKMDVALNTIDNRVVEHETTKLSVTVANGMVKDISFDETTGIFTITCLNGSAKTIDTKLEKLAVNLSYDAENQQLILTLDDGTVQTIDISALITEYEFEESDQIVLSVDGGKVKATIKNGSITEDMIEPGYLAKITVQAEIAMQKATEAEAQKNLAASEADRAKVEADKAAQYSSIVAPEFYVDIDTMTLCMKDGVGVDFVVADNNVICWKIA